ncbi:MAG: type II toxin-antitoxin system RelE/ParE family toxin [Candidatus Omnitrophica bacterium]|nr:type II toxin-antitoxin system RelE/ParE family toxin [Candidatus Omnitrophota bacterium]
MIKTPIIVWAGIARSDLWDIVDHIAGDRPKTALRILGKIEEKVTDLKDFPERGRTVPEFERVGILQYRELIIKPWRVVYRFSGSQIVVLSVLDGRRNVEDVLFRRLTRPDFA